MRIIAIDPGCHESAFVLYDSGQDRIVAHGKVPNAAMLGEILTTGFDALVIEQVQSFGMAVGAEVFDTVWWSGRFHERASTNTMPDRLARLPRKAVKLHLCGTSRANDSNIKQALIDKYGGPTSTADRPKCEACGGKGMQGSGKGKVKCERCLGFKRWGDAGKLHGLKGDEWAALAVAVTFAETRPEDRNQEESK